MCSMSRGKDANCSFELQTTGSRDLKRVVLRPPRTTYFPGAFFMFRYRNQNVVADPKDAFA